MPSQRCPRARASCSGLGAVSQGLAGVISPLGSVTSMRPLRRLIWIGADRVSRPSLASTTVGSPMWLRIRCTGAASVMNATMRDVSAIG